MTDHAGQPDARSAPPLRYFFVPQRRWRRPRRPVRNCGWRPPVPDWRVAHGALPMGRPSGHGDGRGWPRQPKQRRHPRAVWRPGRSLSALLSMVHRFPYRFLYVKAHRKVSCVQDKMLRCGQSVCARHVIRYCSACKFSSFFFTITKPEILCNRQRARPTAKAGNKLLQLKTCGTVAARRASIAANTVCAQPQNDSVTQHSTNKNHTTSNRTSSHEAEQVSGAVQRRTTARATARPTPSQWPERWLRRSKVASRHCGCPTSPSSRRRAGHTTTRTFHSRPTPASCTAPTAAQNRCTWTAGARIRRTKSLCARWRASTRHCPSPRRNRPPGAARTTDLQPTMPRASATAPSPPVDSARPRHTPGVRSAC